MIREIINFVKHLEDDYPDAFNLNKTPSPGLHLWVELDEKGNWKNPEPKEGKDYVVYDGKQEIKGLLNDARDFWELGRTIGGATNTNKCISNKKIHSCNPFIFAFKTENLSSIDEKIISTYFLDAQNLCLSDNIAAYSEKSKSFSLILNKLFKWLNEKEVIILNKGKTTTVKFLKTLKSKDYINLYLRNIDINIYKLAHDNYLKSKLFNINDYNSEKNITDSTWGVSNFLNGTGAKFSKKVFLQHKTAPFYHGISNRITMNDAFKLNKFEILSYQKGLPTPLPIFIDKQEFKIKNDVTSSEFIRLFDAEGEKRTFPQILKSLYKNNEHRVLANYYLLNFTRGVVNDFDFVSKFEYQLDNCTIKNLFDLKVKKEFVKDYHLKSIFDFEKKVVA